MITVNPAGVPVASVTLNPVKVVGTHSSTGTVTLSAAAPSGGQIVALSSSDTSSATVPQSVTVPAGSKSTTFHIASADVQAMTYVNIAATDSNVAKSASLQVSFEILRISFSPDNVTGGHSTTGTITLSAPAPSDLAIDFKSSDAAIAPAPRPIVIPAGATQGTFKIVTKKVTVATPVSVEAYANTAGHLIETLNVEPVAA